MDLLFYPFDEFTTVRDNRVCGDCANLDRDVFLPGKGPTIPLHDGCRCHYERVWLTLDEWRERQRELKAARRAKAQTARRL